jgi:hypothetical protein
MQQEHMVPANPSGNVQAGTQQMGSSLIGSAANLPTNNNLDPLAEWAQK